MELTVALKKRKIQISKQWLPFRFPATEHQQLLRIELACIRNIFLQG